MTLKNNHIYVLLVFCLLIIQFYRASILPLFIHFPSQIIQIIFYGCLSAILFISLKDIHIESRLTLFAIIAIISILLSTSSSRYNAGGRFVIWLLLVSSVGPLIYNYQLIYIRDLLFKKLMLFLMIGGILSFLYWLAGIPSIGRGHFSGIFNHSMLLAPIASIGGIYAFHCFTVNYDYKTKLIYLIVVFISVIDILLAASRSAAIGFIFGIVVLFFGSSFKHKKLILLFVLIIAIFIGIKMNDDIELPRKGDISAELSERGLQNTRATLWHDRWIEFKSNPIFGVGFVSQDDKLNIRKNTSPDGRIEPGSTYLMILSMTGIVGGICILTFMLKLLYWKNFKSNERYKLAFFAFFAVHFLAEGYMFSASSFMAFVFWSLVGASYPYYKS